MGVGLAVGVVLAAGLATLLSGFIVGVSPIDPLTMGTIAVLLTVVGLLASYGPARRAVRIDPASVLRVT